MSKKGLYYTKGKHSQEYRVGQGKELPELRQLFIKQQERIKPRDIPKTSEERAYRELIKEAVKPPSVKMAEAEMKKMAEEARKAQMEKRERQMEDIATMARMFPASSAEQKAMLEKFLSEMGTRSEASAPPSYASLLTPAEKLRNLTPEEDLLETELTNASTKQPLSKNLNNLFNTPRSKTTTGLKVLNKLSADGLRRALKNADDNGRVLDDDFKRAIRQLIKTKGGK